MVGLGSVPVVLRLVGSVWAHFCYMACDDLGSISVTVDLLRPIDKDAAAALLGTTYPDIGPALVQAITAPLRASYVSEPVLQAISRSLFTGFPARLRRNSYFNTRDASYRVELTVAGRCRDARGARRSISD